MRKPLSDGTIEIEVTDFGPIRSAEIELRPLTVFVGPSNTGKSYLSALIYALHRFFGSDLNHSEFSHANPTLSGSSLLYPRPILPDDSAPITAQSIAEIVSWIDHNLSATHSEPLILPPPISESIRPLVAFTKSKEFGDQIASEIVRCIGVNNPTDLIRYKTKPTARVTVRNRASNDSSFIYDLTIGESEHNLAAIIPATSSLEILARGRMDRFLLQRSIERLKARQVIQQQTPLGRTPLEATPIGQMPGGPSRSAQREARALIRQLANLVFPHIVGQLTSTAYYLPADRTGLMHTYRMVVSALLGSAAVAGIRPTTTTPILSGILADFLNNLIQIGGVSSKQKRPENDLGERIEDQVLGGSIGINTTDAGYPSFYYKPRNWDRELPLMSSSSMISELAPVVLYLRYIVRPGDVLIIEEPESHLHPERQADFACEIARIVHAGVRVIITTHSDLILEQIGNLIRLSELPEEDQADIIKTRSTLDQNQVGTWLFSSSDTGSDSVVEEATLDPVTGLFRVGYDSVRRRLYNQGARSFNRLQALRNHA